MVHTRLIAAASALTLALISFIFTLLTTTSHTWAYQHHYNPATVPALQTAPLFTINRSPFHVCAWFQDPDNGDIFNKTCSNWRPFGHNRTSCELITATQNLDDPRNGDERLCQQVHLAGNLAIAASVFSGVSFLAALAVTVLALTSRPAGDGRSKPRPIPWRLATTTTSVLLLIASGLLFLAQFYGFEAFIVSNPPNSVFSSPSRLPDPNNQGPWVQGKGNLEYACVGWLSGILGVGCLWVLRGERLVENKHHRNGIDNNAVEREE